MVALEATFVPENAAELRASYELRLGEERFSVDVGGGTIAIARDSPRRPDVVIDTDPGYPHVLVGHVLPLVLLVGAGAGIGYRMFRLRRIRR